MKDVSINTRNVTGIGAFEFLKTILSKGLMHLVKINRTKGFISTGSISVLFTTRCTDEGQPLSIPLALSLAISPSQDGPFGLSVLIPAPLLPMSTPIFQLSLDVV
jgi:hypothetical protein